MNYNDLLTFWKDEFIVLNLFLRRWKITQCAETFDRVTRQLFRAERQRANVFRTIRRILQCWLSDDCYDVEIFEILLNKNFKNQQRMFDSLQLNSKAKIVVTITTISNVFSFVFSKYNEIDIRHSNNDKFAFWTRKFFLRCLQIMNIFDQQIQKTSFAYEKRKWMSFVIKIKLINVNARITSIAFM
jgi:hypothetical protein